MADGTPPLPDGFTLDAPVSAPPPLPAGFTLDGTVHQTAGGAVQAASSGLNRGAADVLGLPIDTARNVIELGKAGLGFAYHEATGNQIPQALQPNETPDVGSSAWIKEKLRNIEGSQNVDVTENTRANRIISGAAEGIPSSLVGGEANAAPALIRAGTAGAVAGAAQQGAAEAGIGTGGQTAISMLAGAAAGHAAAPREAPVTPKSSTPEPTGGFTPPKPLELAPSEPGMPPKLDIGGDSTAADQTKKGVQLPAIGTHVPEGTEAAAALPADQSAREQTLRDVGVKEARLSAISGDTKETGNDFQTSKLNNEAGNRMSGVIDQERTALQNYASNLTDNAGAQTRGVDSPALYQRGQLISKPVEELSDYYDSKIKDAYRAADEKAQGIPISMPTLNESLSANRSQFLGTVEGKQLLEGVNARMQDLGLMDQSGTGGIKPATVQQAEQLKQYLNNQWTPRTSRLIGDIKNSIDEDVTKAAGSDIYANARATRAARATLLDDPTGIAKLAAPEDRLGINRSVPLERVPDYVTHLPADQFAHIVGTLRDVPPEVAPSASAALNEIRGHFATRLEAAGNSTQGMWNQKGVNQYLKDNQLKMAHVFTPTEMQQFKTLHDAGAILRMDRSYPGAAAQGHNLVQQGVLHAAEHASAAGAVLGSHIPVVGNVIGAIAGAGVKAGANKLVGNSSVKAVEKRIKTL